MSSLERCPLFRMSFIERFHCIKCNANQKMMQFPLFFHMYIRMYVHICDGENVDNCTVCRVGIVYTQCEYVLSCSNVHAHIIRTYMVDSLCMG